MAWSGTHHRKPSCPPQPPLPSIACSAARHGMGCFTVKRGVLQTMAAVVHRTAGSAVGHGAVCSVSARQHSTRDRARLQWRTALAGVSQYLTYLGDQALLIADPLVAIRAHFCRGVGPLELRESQTESTPLRKTKSRAPDVAQRQIDGTGDSDKWCCQHQLYPKTQKVTSCSVIRVGMVPDGSE